MSFFRVQSSASVMHVDMGSVKPEDTQAVEVTEVYRDQQWWLGEGKQ